MHSQRRPRPGRTGRARRALVLAVVVALCGTGLAAAAPWLLARAGIDLDRTALPWADPCSVDTGEGTVMLTLAQARRATTAVALEARGEEGPDTSGIDPAVLRRLREGPPDDAGPSLTCRASTTDGLEREDLTETGLTPRAQAVLDAMGEVFGEMSLGGYEPGGIGTGHGEDSAHYDGRAIDVFYRPVTEENRREGWLLAHWLVAHAEELHIANVIFDDKIWNARGSRGGWWPYRSPDPNNEILRHLDHVHVDVQEGGD
ncbi:hypothetical protein ACFPZ0_15410 [Streptomonospora nanhaiensis]|uniref:ARB-07466-like C-terminal domain-containing protein n=1 Tax=Streptomonospora nanhaiensis TaxID=1323731 RepID=A0A853BJ70_9ACTN|nr:hypothetical protein [Streptomonospora nanhaiensis]MBV2366174.1 hypothetical protein [Streptomonospora nanhaiensis]MBX9391818.1 hypothetical protein [Streptomonospora nanhaiensis]NYI94622.1 hypothetical protein [Streptomonospora nanhaiensis]